MLGRFFLLCAPCKQYWTFFFLVNYGSLSDVSISAPLWQLSILLASGLLRRLIIKTKSKYIHYYIGPDASVRHNLSVVTHAKNFLKKSRHVPRFWRAWRLTGCDEHLVQYSTPLRLAPQIYFDINIGRPTLHEDTFHTFGCRPRPGLLGLFRFRKAFFFELLAFFGVHFIFGFFGRVKYI